MLEEQRGSSYRRWTKRGIDLLVLIVLAPLLLVLFLSVGSLVRWRTWELLCSSNKYELDTGTSHSPLLSFARWLTCEIQTASCCMTISV